MSTTAPRSRTHTSVSQAYPKELERAIQIADHYGFRLAEPLVLERADRDHADKHNYPHEHVACMRRAEAHLGKETDIFLAAHLRKVPYKNKLELRLETAGDIESSAEGLLFQTVRAILEEYGHTNLLVGVNSIGGRENASSFIQAVGTYIRSNLADLHPECRSQIRTSLFAPFRCSHEACITIRENAPQSINYLNEGSRNHFREVLEYLESLGIAYIVDPTLVGNEYYTTRTVFSIGIPTTDQSDAKDTRQFSRILAWGERYDYLSKKIGMRKTIPAVHATINLDIETDEKDTTTPLEFVPSIPNAYLVQVGLAAKIRTLILHEILRKARINISVSLHKKSVAEQIDRAHALGTPFIIIIGHKEVREGAALVRHLPTNQQRSVPFLDLPHHLKHVRSSQKTKL